MMTFFIKYPPFVFIDACWQFDRPNNILIWDIL